jgi:hypothetical protein
LPQKSRNIALSVQHPKDRQGHAAGLINDQVREDSVEQNRPAGEIGPAVTDPWHFGQPVKGRENLGDDPVRRFQAFPFQNVKPNGVNIENGVFGKLNGSKIYRPKSER